MKQHELADLAILGILADRGMLQYKEIQQNLSHIFGRYWAAGSGVLLPSIQRLSSRNEVEEFPDDSDTVRYAITGEGERRLRNLLTDTSVEYSDHLYNPSLTVKIGFLHHLPSEAHEQELEKIQKKLEEERDSVMSHWKYHVEEIEEADIIGYREGLFDLRMRMLDAFINWIDEQNPSEIITTGRS